MCKGKKIEEFEISMVCYNLDNKYTLDQINDMFVDWTESKDIYIGGSIKRCEGEAQPEPESKFNKHCVNNRRKLLIAYGEWIHKLAGCTDIEKATRLADSYLSNL